MYEVAVQNPGWQTITPRPVGKARAIALADEQPARAVVCVWQSSEQIHDNGKPSGTGKPAEPTVQICPAHSQPMHFGGKGYVRCPVATCQETRRTECGAFIRRQRPQGITVVCHEPVAVETWAVLPDGREVYLCGRCQRHPDTARYAGSARIRYRRAEGLMGQEASNAPQG